MEAVFYIHGQGGSAQEAAHYRPLFPGCTVIGLEWHPARLTVMEGGEHWFHTEAQMQFLDRWIREITDC